MKRVGGLWETLTSWPNLVEAAHRAALGKRSRPDVAEFLARQESLLPRLRSALLDGSYRPGEYRVFEIREPKPRLISAAPFLDRVVHHALTQVLEPVFERRFSAHSFACRKGKGTHAAVAHAARAARDCEYALCLDVRKYFASIDHAILADELARVIKCRETLALASAIIAGSNEQEPAQWYFEGDDLFTPFSRRRGIPLGNQTSQFFANVYLDPVDQFIERELRPAAYARYVDDLLLLDPDKGRLREARAAIEESMGKIRLRIHAGKSRIYRTRDGVTFLGWRVFPEKRRLVRENVARFRRRLRGLRARWSCGEVDWREVRQSVAAWIGHAMHGDTQRLRNELFGKVPFGAVKADVH